MGLNIVATRKYDLSDFATGWQGAHVTVKVPNGTDRNSYVDFMTKMQVQMNQELRDLPANESTSATSAKYDAIADEKVTDMVRTLIQGGKVVSTNEDGSQTLVDFTKEDVDAVVDSLSFAWKSDIVDLALGNDRLKAKN